MPFLSLLLNERVAMIIYSGRSVNAVPPCSNTEIQLLNKLRCRIPLLKVGNLQLMYTVGVFHESFCPV